MARVQCVACARVLCGRRHSSCVQHVRCESCARAKLRRLHSRVASLRLSFHHARALHALASKRLRFLSFWNHEHYHARASHHRHHADQELLLQPQQEQPQQDPDRGFVMPPLPDVSLQPPDGPSVPAHRAILAGKSPAFYAIFCNPIAREQRSEGEGQEESPHSVPVDDLPYAVLKAFVQFFYTAAVDSDVMEAHSVLLYHAADKYSVSLLKTLCEEWIIKNVSDRNALSNLKLAKQYGLDALKDAVFNAASSHIDKIPYYAEYPSFVEKDPALLLELYEGSVRKLGKKRKWNGK